MKKFLCVVLAGSLLFTSGVLASEDELFENRLKLDARNLALTDYLTENLSDAFAGNGNALNALVERFSEKYPEFQLEMTDEKPDTGNANIVETTQIYASEKSVSDSVTEGLEYSVTYYDNGYFMIGESSYTRTEN